MTAAADPGTGAPSNGHGGTVLAFMNEVAGGRKLLEAVRERVAAGVNEVAVVAPQNLPVAGQIVDRDEVREAALSRVEVTQAVLHEFGIDSAGAIMDPDPALALDDAIRAFTPREVLLSCLYATRFGYTRKDLAEWAKQTFEVPITHIPVRIEDDAIRWDVTHTLVVATRTVASSGLVARLKSRIPSVWRSMRELAWASGGPWCSCSPVAAIDADSIRRAPPRPPRAPARRRAAESTTAGRRRRRPPRAQRACRSRSARCRSAPPRATWTSALRGWR